MASFQRDRRFKVAVEDAVSEERPVLAGVPQGSCLCPACYVRYTDDILVAESVHLALYADDATYLVSSISPKHAVAVKMQHALHALPEWLDKWRLSVNVRKTEALLTGHRLLPPPLRLHGQDIGWQSQVKYLTYAAPAWFALVSETNKKRLRAQHERTIVSAPCKVRNVTIVRDLEWEELEAFVA